MKSLRSSVGELEIRAVTAAEASLDGDDRFIRGYPIVFNKLSQDLGGFKERILPEAVDRSLKADIRGLVDHDTSKVLARTKSRTMTVRKNRNGVLVEMEPDLRITYASDIVHSVARGDVDGMSFAFRVIEEDWHMEEGKTPIRDIIDMEISEFSIVTFPAYLDTDVQVAKRSMDIYMKRTVFNWRAKFHEIQEISRG